MFFGIKRNVIRKSDALASNIALALVEFYVGKRVAWLDCKIDYEAMSGTGGLYQNAILTGHLSKEGEATSTAAKVKVQLCCPDLANPTALEGGTHVLEVHGHEKTSAHWVSPDNFSVRFRDRYGCPEWRHNNVRIRLDEIYSRHQINVALFAVGARTLGDLIGYTRSHLKRELQECSYTGVVPDSEEWYLDRIEERMKEFGYSFRAERKAA